MQDIALRLRADIASAAVARAQAEKVNWTNMGPDYLRTIEYTWRWLGGFMLRPEPRDTRLTRPGSKSARRRLPSAPRMKATQASPRRSTMRRWSSRSAGPSGIGALVEG